MYQCQQCQDLWTGYIEARKEYLRLQGKLVTAGNEAVGPVSATLEASAREAWALRQTLRQGLLAHAEATHASVAAATCTAIAG